MAKSILKLKEKDIATVLSPTEVWSPSTIRNKTGGKRIRCRFRSIGAHADRNTAELETVRVSESPMTLQWRSANERTSNSVCQRNGFIRDSKASRRYTGVLSLGKLCEDHGQWSETTTH